MSFLTKATVAAFFMFASLAALWQQNSPVSNVGPRWGDSDCRRTTTFILFASPPLREMRRRSWPREVHSF